MDAILNDRVAAAGGRLYPMFWRWHFFAAALVIPFVLWQSVSGTLYLWSEWWMDVRHPELRFVIPAESPSSYAAQVAAVLAAVQNAPVQEILVPTDPARSTTVLLIGDNNLPVPVFVDPNGARVLGQLSSAEWLPGLSRALHRGWPFGEPGNWLLELGNCWAIVMLFTGLYLWWPYGRSFPEVLWPRLHLGTRTALRELHSCVAVWFSAIFLFFTISAMPWTHFWGGVILPQIQTVLDQNSPTGFSVGGASSAQVAEALPTIDAIVQRAREENIAGTLDIKLDSWPGAPWWMTNVHNPAGTDRYLMSDTENGEILGSYTGADLPLIPAAVALGVHLHQGDFGPINLWLNTSLAMALIWLSMTGLLSWWQRRPRGQLAVPPARKIPWPGALVVTAAVMGIVFPLFGLSILALILLDQMTRPLRGKSMGVLS